jgi:two-component system response regulator HydG
MDTCNILIIDDNLQILQSLKILLQADYGRIESIQDPKGIPDMIGHNGYDIVLLDMNFISGETTGREGFHWLKEILELDPRLVVIMITAYGDIELAVKCIRQGAMDFITKPWDTEKLLATIRSACELRKSRLEVVRLKGKKDLLTKDIDRNFRTCIGSSKVFKDMMNTISKVAPTDANVLILGENGTGKELIAREIHRNSLRSEDVFIGVDVAALTETLFESEMFGYVKGAFTDAKNDHPGRFEIANGGTLFLDEIGNLSLSLQAKLLQVIESREVTRVGSHRSSPVDIRLISATNKPILQMVGENIFREDLLYRINTIQIEVPPLRDRKEDIPGLTDYFLREYTRKYEKLHLKLSSKTMDKLIAYNWPGNIRELRHTIEKSVILCDDHTIRPEDLFIDKMRPVADIKEPLKLSEIEKQAIIKAIQDSGGNYSQAARILDISRTTLYAKMKNYGI